jgi:hypothetical protein
MNGAQPTGGMRTPGQGVIASWLGGLVYSSLSAPPPLPQSVIERVRQYAIFFGVNHAPYTKAYERCPARYSLEEACVVAENPIKAAARFSGHEIGTSPYVLSGSTNNYGFNYAQLRAVAARERHLSFQTHTTLFCFDVRVMKLMEHGIAVAVLDQVLKLTPLTNHDPLHGINADNKGFVFFDKEFRYGGVEFVPIALHAQFVRAILLQDATYRDALESTVKEAPLSFKNIPLLVDSSGHYQGYDARLYAASIILKHLLLFLPMEDTRVQQFLNDCQEQLFDQKSVTLATDRYRRLIRRDFSMDDGVDSVSADDPKHINRNRDQPYLHGRDSLILGPFIREFVDRFVQQHQQSLSEETMQLPMSKMLLLDVILRSCGTYAIASATQQARPQTLLFRNFVGCL